jgi:hypothetical protein
MHVSFLFALLLQDRWNAHASAAPFDMEAHTIMSFHFSLLLAVHDA